MLFKEDFGTNESLKCQCGNCIDEGLFIHSKCHVDADIQVEFVYSTGSLMLYCGECNAPVAEIAVASKGVVSNELH